MGAPRDEGRPDPPEPAVSAVRAERLRLLAGLPEELSDREMLLHALLHATAELGGLSGMAHMRERISKREMVLVVSAGTAHPFTRAWDRISERGPVAPALSVQRGGYAYVPEAGVPTRFHGRPPGPVGPAAAPEGYGMAAVPLDGEDGPVGALSVVVPAAHAPGPGQRAFFEDVARWAGGRLRLTPRGPEGVSPGLLSGQDARAAADAPRREPEGEPDRGPEAVLVGNWTWDLRTGEVAIDRSQGTPSRPVSAEFHIDMASWDALVHPDDLPWVVAETSRAVRTRGVLDLEFRLRRRDGTYGWVRDHGHVVTDEHGTPVRVEGTTQDTTRTHDALESVGRALLHMSDGFLSVTGDGRIAFVNAAAERLLGPSRELVARPLWEAPVLRGAPGVREGCRRAVAEGEPVVFEVPGREDGQWYHLRLVPIPDGLTVYVADVTERHRREAERQAAERAAAQRAALMAGLTRALAEAVTARDVVDAVAGSVLPAFGASGLLVMRLERERLHLVGSVGYSRDFAERVHGMPLFSSVTGGAMRSRTPEFTESAAEFLSRHPQRDDVADADGKQAGAALPLVVSGRPIGVCVVSYDGPHHFGEDERTLLTALSGLVAQALERAGLYDAAATRARDLQRALLPRALPSSAALTAAARYLPAGQGADVGGDWYDVIPLSADRVALVIGDVMGHGIPEAATMGRLRTAVRTLSDLELPPDEVLAHVNDVVAELGEEAFTTCLYGVYDPTTQVFAYADAGHLPPAVALPDGTVTFPSLEPDPPLGVAAPPFGTEEVRLPEGSVLVLYTDGLVEEPGRDIDDGMGRLAQTLATALRDGDGLGGGPVGADRASDPERLCDRVTAALLPADRPAADDTALLVARTRALAPEDIAVWELPEDPIAASQARKYVRDQLDAWHLGEDLEMTTELIASELVGNVIRHARGPIRLRLLHSRTLICEVADGSLTTPHIRHASVTDEGGRGLQLVAAMARSWGTRYTATGKCIWTEQAIPADRR
ncbi:SpoIIE family protein phosphatase [Streptomyces sp. B1866]|uniref:SpoIIE family protein phosphatase n=1 Tax=Streptomyces sp. B1866 TaxID=3075431 RepID=UPI002890191B|nr:SpoIIE family protein phosphatase [Streptomyces sp. B1866]MDT3396607.1 SpoIIE family protein phosphatase [Streptomyces sp. B1866]